MVEALTPIEIFCSYAHEDEEWRKKLETHLSLLKRQGLISLWHDRLIVAGTNWAKEIDTHLETASVILLLVSADFLTSNYCVGIEMKRALERQEAGEARVIPILVRPVDWDRAPFAHLQALPTDAKPLVTWEHLETALADITAGIRRVIEEVPLLSVSAPRATLPPIWNIPYSRNPFFLGRDNELLRIRQNLQTGQATALSQPQAISGLGGIGKTQLALEYAYRHHQDYQIVLWARAESADALTSSYVAIAALLRLPEQEAREQEVVVQGVKTWLQTHRGWLLILDNADELTLLPNFLPPTLGGHLLLTTRAAMTGRLAHRLEIETLPPEHGALFLYRRAGLIAPDAPLEQAPLEERSLALEISRELGGLPLALDQAGAYLEETGTSLGSYWHIYQQHRTALLRERRGLVDDHPTPVATTWLLSFQRVEEKNPAAADLLHLCAFLSPDAIAEEILITGASVLGPLLAPVVADAFQLNQAIEALRAYSLVRRDPKGKTLTVHRLVQAVVQGILSDTEKRSWAERAVFAVNAAFPQVEPHTWSHCERVLPQALLATQLIKQYQMIGEEAGGLLHKTASYLLDRARYTEAKGLFQRALDIYEQHFWPEHPLIADPLYGLASLAFELGQEREAEALYQQALQIKEQRFGPEHPQVTDALYGLARVYRDQGKYAEAEALYQRFLQICEQHLGSEHPQMANVLYGLGLLSFQRGEIAEAEQIFLRAVRSCEQRYGPEYPLIAHPLNGLGRVYREQGKDAEAEALQLRCLHIWEQCYGPEHPLVTHPLTNLAHIYRDWGKDVEAEALWQRALRNYEQHLGPEHRYVVDPLNGLASLYAKQGKYAKAEALYQRALRIREQYAEAPLPDAVPSLVGLADLYCQQSKYAKAEALCHQALRIWEQRYGLEHPRVAYPLNRLANLYRRQSKYTEAEALFQHALSILEQAAWGSEHSEKAESMYGLAQLWEAQGNNEDAKTWYVRAVVVREQALGAHHPKTMEIRACLIALLHTMGQHEEAAQFEAVQSEL